MPESSVYRLNRTKSQAFVGSKPWTEVFALMLAAFSMPGITGDFRTSESQTER